SVLRHALRADVVGAGRSILLGEGLVAPVTPCLDLAVPAAFGTLDNERLFLLDGLLRCRSGGHAIGSLASESCPACQIRSHSSLTFGSSFSYSLPTMMSAVRSVLHAAWTRP